MTSIAEITNNDAGSGDDKHENVASERIVVGTVAWREEAEARVQVILGQSLQHPGCTDQRRDSRRQCGGEATGVDQVTSVGNQSHVLEEKKKMSTEECGELFLCI